jgi:hypothetical protein
MATQCLYVERGTLRRWIGPKRPAVPTPAAKAAPRLDKGLRFRRRIVLNPGGGFLAVKGRGCRETRLTC